MVNGFAIRPNRLPYYVNILIQAACQNSHLLEVSLYYIVDNASSKEKEAKLPTLTGDKQSPRPQSAPTRSQLPTSQPAQLLVSGMTHGYCFELAALVDSARVVEAAAARTYLTQLKKCLFSHRSSRSSFCSSLFAAHSSQHFPSMRRSGSVLIIVATRITLPKRSPPK